MAERSASSVPIFAIRFEPGASESNLMTGMPPAVAASIDLVIAATSATEMATPSTFCVTKS